MTRRTAIATLELVLALPVILVLLVAMVWLGYAVIGQAEVTAKARHDAWSMRFEPWAGSPFAFSESQAATGEANTTINVSPLLDGFGDPEAHQTIAQANWDHRSVRFEPLPNWELYAEVAVAGKREGLLSDYQDVRSTFEQIRSIGSTALTDALWRAAEDLTNPSRRFDSSGQSQRQRLQLEGDLEAQQRRGKLLDLQRDIDQQQRKLDELKTSDVPEDAESSHEDRIWLEEQVLQRLKIQRELVESDE